MDFKQNFKRTVNVGILRKRNPEIPDGLIKRCKVCRSAVFVEEARQNLDICPRCGTYFRMHARRRIEEVLDEGSFEEWDTDLEEKNPLGYRGYPEKILVLREKTGLDEAVLTGKGRINGLPTVFGVCDSRFLMASMGEVVGEKVTRAVERATKDRLPVIFFICSGGARMQEGMTSLMQMAKTAAALRRHSDAGLLSVNVLTNPTTGGVTASFAMLGDIILAEPGALIGFAGPRVIEQTIGQKLPAGFQSSEFLLEHGFLDGIVERKEMKEMLHRILRLHGGGTAVFQKETEQDTAKTGKLPPGGNRFQAMPAACGNPEGFQADSENESLISESASTATASVTSDYRIASLRSSLSTVFTRCSPAEKLEAWDHVSLARSAERPKSADLLPLLFDNFLELHGDRCFRDDPSVIGGLAFFEGQPVTVIAQEKGHGTKENVRRNFGMVSPEGYRKARRLMKQAEKFLRPVLFFVDTPGAFCGMEAEERGQGEAIARSLYELSALKVPVLSLIIGEGGSGGALAFALADEVWMMEHAVYSILSPEGFASILWKDSSKAREAAKVMGMTAAQLKKQGMVEEVIPEETPLTLENLPRNIGRIREGIRLFLSTYGSFSEEKLLKHRWERFRIK